MTPLVRRVDDRRPSRARPVLLTAMGLAVLAYAWWATGLGAFTAVAYAAVAVPAVALVVVSSVARPTGRPRDASAPPSPVTVARLWPWLVLAGVAAGLELVALALGGRSPTVPTVSTVTDHAMAWHATRVALFLVWLAVGWWSTVTDLRRRWEGP